MYPYSRYGLRRAKGAWWNLRLFGATCPNVRKVSFYKKKVKRNRVANWQRVWRILPKWAITYVPILYAQFFKVSEAAQKWTTFRLVKKLCNNLAKKWIGLHLGRLFHKRIWSLCQWQRVYNIFWTLKRPYSSRKRFYLESLFFWLRRSFVTNSRPEKDASGLSEKWFHQLKVKDRRDPLLNLFFRLKKIWLKIASDKQPSFVL
jgi:hypothetical protein